MTASLKNLLKLVTLFFISVGSVCSAGVQAEEGKELYSKHCATCHTLTSEGPQRQGPTLVRVLGRKAGSIKNFPYSDGLKAAPWEWTTDKLESWLINPQRLVPDSYMMYRQENPVIRKKIIQFLSINSANKKGT